MKLSTIRFVYGFHSTDPGQKNRMHLGAFMSPIL